MARPRRVCVGLVLALAGAVVISLAHEPDREPDPSARPMPDAATA